MPSSPLLIFDLDDTIFETKTIGHHHVSSALNDFENNIKSFFSSEEVDRIMSDLWKYPFDHVANKYNLTEFIRRQFSNVINSLDYKLDIQVFSDFEIVRNIEAPKLLVTTGFKKLQLAKIDALKIEDVFNEIHVDEIDSVNRTGKRGIFEQVLSASQKDKMDFIVIGDNPESELKAGYDLGLNTVQVAKFDQPKSEYAKHYIKDFQELVEIIGTSE